MSRSTSVRRLAGIAITFIAIASGGVVAQTVSQPGPSSDSTSDPPRIDSDLVDGAFNTDAQASAEEISGQVVTDGEVMLLVGAEPRRVQVAQPVEFQLLVEAPAGTIVTFPQVADTLGELNVIHVGSVTSVPVDGDSGRRQWSIAMMVDSLQPGTHQIPEMEVAYRLKDQSANARESRVIRSLPVTVRVEGVVPEGQDSKEFRGIKGTLLSPDAEKPNSKWTWWIGGLLLAACGMVVVMARSRFRRNPLPSDWALAEMDRIEEGSRQGAIKGDRVYDEVSRVIRQFVESELGIESTTMSTAEISMRMGELGMDSDAVAVTTKLLDDADEVKFSGRDRPSRSDGDSPIDLARKVIQQLSSQSTLPQPTGGD